MVNLDGVDEVNGISNIKYKISDLVLQQTCCISPFATLVIQIGKSKRKVENHVRLQGTTVLRAQLIVRIAELHTRLQK